LVHRGGGETWGIAFFEYLIQVPANRMGYGTFSLGQLKIMQEVKRLRFSFPSRSTTWDSP